MRPSFASLPPFTKSKGAGKAGCTLHPRSRVQFALENAHTSIQGSGGIPAFPARWVTAYFVLFPENGFLASVAPRQLAARGLSASTAAPEPHDFTVRVRHLRQPMPFASTASHRAFVTWPTPLGWMRCAELWG